MNSFLVETLPGRIAYVDFSSTPVECFTYEFIGGEGVIHESRLFLRYEDIYFGEIEDNPARQKGSSAKNIKKSASSRSLGIDPAAELPLLVLVLSQILLVRLIFTEQKTVSPVRS